MRTANLDEPKSRRASLLLAILLLGFVAVVFYLFAQRFGAGDIYPRYSSLRADEFGIKILNDSLEKAGYGVHRNYRLLHKMEIEPPATFLFVGFPFSGPLSLFAAQNQDELLELSKKGGRLVLTLPPMVFHVKKEECECANQEESAGESDSQGEESAEESTEPAASPDDQEEVSVENENGPESLGDTLGFTLNYLEKEEDDEEKRETSAYGIIGETSVRIPWSSTAYFAEVADDWRVVLSIGEYPVLLERSLGKGSLVVATDSRFLSNEALWSERDAYFLTWLMGGNRTVVFDEVHHGVQRQVSLSRLLRDFNLHWVIIGLLAPALLFIRRCSSPLAPPLSGVGKNADHQQGRDQFSGLVNILRGHPPDKLLSVCVDLWLKSNRDWREKYPREAEEIQQIAREPTSGKVVENYKQIAGLLRRHIRPALNNHLNGKRS